MIGQPSGKDSLGVGNKTSVVGKLDVEQTRPAIHSGDNADTRNKKEIRLRRAVEVRANKTAAFFIFNRDDNFVLERMWSETCRVAHRIQSERTAGYLRAGKLDGKAGRE